MNLLCAIDEAYTQHCAVMLTSLFRNTPDKGFKVFVLHQGLPQASLDRLKHVCEKAGHTFVPVVADHAALPDLPILRHFMLASYLRLLVTHVLPKEIDRVLYLDADVVVRSDLRQLYELDLGEHPLAAVAQIEVEGDAERLGIDPAVQYFNSGVLLMNLALWREEDLGEEALRFVLEHVDVIEWPDQDALNGVLNGRALMLPPKWNAGEWIFHPQAPELLQASEDELREARQDPAIAHFTGGNKPWIGGMDHPFAHEYYSYLKQTPYYGRRHMFARMRRKGEQVMRKLAFK